MKLSFYDDESADDIPNMPGVYAFFYMGLSSKLFGFPGNERPLSAIRSSAERSTTRQLETFRDSDYHGELSSTSHGAHIRPPFFAQLRANTTTPIAEGIRQIGDRDLKGFIGLMAASSVFQKPLYVGITTEQTLADRYLQHRQCYFQVGTGFGASLKKAGLTWSNVTFGCIAYTEHRLSAKTTRIAEKLIQSLASPVFSKQ